jgi:hypothetical protein
MKTFDEHIQDLAQTILTTRDLCGDERTAIRDYLADHGFTPGSPNAVIIADKARIEANRQWQWAQREAGVTSPISPEERATITRTLDRA